MIMAYLIGIALTSVVLLWTVGSREIRADFSSFISSCVLWPAFWVLFLVSMWTDRR
jgi:hypothetical protein